MAKQMLGAARQCVFAEASRLRLPELALLAGSLLAYIAATQPAVPTGFWDRTPRSPPVGCAVSWPRCIMKTCRPYPPIFAKSRRQPRTCLQAYTGIADRKKAPLCAMIGHSPHDAHCYRKVKYND